MFPDASIRVFQVEYMWKRGDSEPLDGWKQPMCVTSEIPLDK